MNDRIQGSCSMNCVLWQYTVFAEFIFPSKHPIAYIQNSRFMLIAILNIKLRYEFGSLEISDFTSKQTFVKAVWNDRRIRELRAGFPWRIVPIHSGNSEDRKVKWVFIKLIVEVLSVQRKHMPKFKAYNLFLCCFFQVDMPQY